HPLHHGHVPQLRLGEETRHPSRRESEQSHRQGIGERQVVTRHEHPTPPRKVSAPLDPPPRRHRQQRREHLDGQAEPEPSTPAGKASDDHPRTLSTPPGRVRPRPPRTQRFGSRTTTGISRSVLRRYSSYVGNTAAMIRHNLSRSSPVAVLARAANRSAFTCTRTSGSTRRVLYQSGWSAAPPLDATTTYHPSCSWKIKATLRGRPVFRPVVVRMRIGAPCRR